MGERALLGLLFSFSLTPSISLLLGIVASLGRVHPLSLLRVVIARRARARHVRHDSPVSLGLGPPLCAQGWAARLIAGLRVRVRRCHGVGPGVAQRLHEGPWRGSERRGVLHLAGRLP